MRSSANKTSVVLINLSPNFTKRKYTITFYNFEDIFKNIGGVRSALLPFLGIGTPFLMIWFLYLLSGIILGKNQDELTRLIL